MRRIMWVFLLGLLLVMATHAQVPREISFQGKIAGVASPVNLQFKIFDDATAGSELWSENHLGTALDGEGLFNVILGQTTPIDLDFIEDYWIEVWVNGAPLPTRYKLTADAYAFRAIYADTVDWGGIKAMPAGFADGVDDEGGGLPAGASGNTLRHNGTDWIVYCPEKIKDKLWPEEFNLIKLHPTKGYDILKSIEFSWQIADIILQHHERLDGSGYPNGLKGEEILIEARIIGVADVVEAMASHRPYGPALGIDVALDEITKNKGKLYDPDIVSACIEVFEDGFEF